MKSKVIYVDPFFGDITIFDIIKYLEDEISKEQEIRQELATFLSSYHVDTDSINSILRTYYSYDILRYIVYILDQIALNIE